MFAFTETMRGRLLLWLALLLICILAGFGVTAFQLHRINMLNQLDEELSRRVAAITAEVRFRGPGGPGPPPSQHAPEGTPPLDFTLDPRGRPKLPPGGPGPLGREDEDPRRRKVFLSASTLGLFNEADPNGFYFVFWSRDGDLLKKTANAPAGVEFPERESVETVIHRRTRDAFREAYHFTEMGECALAGRAITADLPALRRFGWWLAAADGAVLALGLGGGWWLVSRAIRPVEEISAAASRISGGNLSERIKAADSGSELGRLAGVLNSTFARLEAAFARQKQFTADASHELRTPLAILISEAQTTLARKRSAAEYEESVAACLETAQQMRQLTDSLLELARADAGGEDVPRTRINVADCAKACVQRMAPLAAQAGIEIQGDFAPAAALANSDRLSQVIANLLANAIQYNKPGGKVRLSTRAGNGTALLIVADTGIGIAAPDLPHIFERFYRVDKARSRAAGHSGLGLAICKSLLEADGGSIEVSSQPGVGSTFSVRWPV
jgi:heavy metal sensor kinase